MQDSVGLSEMPSYLAYLLIHPEFNIMAALILYAAIAVLLLLILVIGIMVLTRQAKGAETIAPEADPPGPAFDDIAAGDAFEGLEPDSVPVSAVRQRPRPKARRRAVTREARRNGRILGLVVLAVAWLATGYTTSDPELCKDCHWPAAQHANAPEPDVHSGVACVSCHERGGTVGRYVIGVPLRLSHFLSARSDTTQNSEYGRVTERACRTCHAAALDGVALNEQRGLRVSHAQPLDASATCLDCHALRNGVVGAHNAGMDPCLRCHNGSDASAECAGCHDEKAAAAARARSASFAHVQIPDVSCGGCHDEEQECDWCHGLRLPHSAEFKSYAHARSGAVDFWYNGGKGCARCHTASRRPCQGCHGEILGAAHGSGRTWLASGHKTADAKACDTCHLAYAYNASRDFCKDLCHTPAAVEASPR